MANTDTANAKQYATLAQVAAAQAKIYAQSGSDAAQSAEDAKAAAASAESYSDSASSSAESAASQASSASASAESAEISALAASSAVVDTVKQQISFSTGGTLYSAKDRISDGTYFYYWTGTFPKVIPASSSVSTTGGMGAGAWVADTGIATRSSLTQGGFTQDAITWYDLNMDASLDRTGTVSMTAQINSAIESARLLGITTIKDTTPGGAVYLIDGTDDITVYGHLDLGESKFRYASTWKGQIVIKDPNYDVTTYDSTTTAGTALLAKINASSAQSKLAQSLQLDGLIDDTTLNNHVCIFDTGVPAYYTRSNLRNWKHISLISTRGLMSDPLYYGLTGTVSSVTAWYVKPNTTIIKLPAMDFTEKPHAINVYMYGCSRYEVWGPNVSERPITDTGSEYVLSMRYCFDCEVRWGYDVHPNVSFNGSGSTSLVSSYTLNFNFCLDCKFINQYSMGFGWGSTAGEVCCNTTFMFCKLNRFDFHEPFQGTTKIIDCDVGNNGISMCGMGRLELIRLHWKLETLNAPYTPSETTLIKTRDDIGGWFDGDLYIEGGIVSGGFTYNDNNSILSYMIGGFVNMSTTNTGGITLPVGSPVTPWLFRDITIKGMKHMRRYSTSRYYRPIYSNYPQYLKHPRSIIMDDFDYNCTQPLVFGFGNWRDDYYTADTTSPPMALSETCRIVINRGSFNGLTFAGSSTNHNISVKINQCRSVEYGENGLAIVANMRGIYEINNTDLISLGVVYNSLQPTVPNVIQLNGGVMKSIDTTIMPFTGSTSVYHDLSASNVMFVGNYSASTITDMNTNIARWFRISNCQFQTTTGTKVPYLLLFTGNVGTVSTPIAISIRSGNPIVTSSIYNSLTTTDTFNISNMSGNLGRKLYNGADGGYFFNISITGNCALINSATASATALLRTICIAS
ncbi:hypothetical protein ACXEGP_002352 [Klebsiella quasipneumoniae]